MSSFYFWPFNHKEISIDIEVQVYVVPVPMDDHNLRSPNLTVRFGLVFSVRNSVTHGNEQMRVAGKYWIGFYSIHENEVNKRMTAERKQVWVISTAHGCIYKVGNVLIGGFHSPQSPSRNIWISQPIVIRILISYLSTQTSVKPYRIAPCGLHVSSLHLRCKRKAVSQ